MKPTDPISATVAELLDQLYASELAGLSAPEALDLAGKLRAIASVVAAADAFGAAALRSAADHVERPAR